MLPHLVVAKYFIDLWLHLCPIDVEEFQSAGSLAASARTGKTTFPPCKDGYSLSKPSITSHGARSSLMMFSTLERSSDQVIFLRVLCTSEVRDSRACAEVSCYPFLFCGTVHALRTLGTTLHVHQLSALPAVLPISVGADFPPMGTVPFSSCASQLLHP